MENKIIEKAMEYAKTVFENESSGHDYWHTIRVYHTALYIAEKETCHSFVVQLASLLHDVDDQKIFGGVVGQYDKAKMFMVKNNIDEQSMVHVCKIINKMSYKGDEADEMDTIEGKIVQDADRLDAIGAIGIARAFAFGGNKGREMHHPDIPPKGYMTPEEYKNNHSTTVNHFYEKLLKIKDRMHTETGKSMVKHRHAFMEQFLEEFFEEWNGNK